MRQRRCRGSVATSLIIDVSLTAGLLLALGIVFRLDRSIPVAAEKPVEPVVEVLVPPPATPKLRLGVTPEVAEYDDMGKLLDSLGEGYKYHKLNLDDLLEPDKLAQCDILFVTCSGMSAKWLSQRTGGSIRGAESYAPNEKVLEQAREALRQYVTRGGTLYASDLHFNLIARCFPEFVDNANVGSGSVQSVTAEVVDPALKELIGSQLELQFDQPGWRPAAFSGDKVAALLRGRYQSEDGQERSAPLLVKFALGDGTVIFTSFHNEKQNNEAETKLLRYLVFSAVTAGVETQVAKTMLQSGFSPSKRNLFSTSGGQESVSQTYQCTKVADLQFVLAFQDQGAHLRLTVTGPDGTPMVKDGFSTLTIDVPAAVAGAWKYTVTPLKIPNENFPFTVTVGQK